MDLNGLGIIMMTMQESILLDLIDLIEIPPIIGQKH